MTTAAKQGAAECGPYVAMQGVSPSDTDADVEDKVFDWLHGIRMVMGIDPQKRSAAVYRTATQITHLFEADTLDGADVIPGSRLQLSELFA